MTETRKYKEFTPKEDNIQLVIQAKDVNELQESIIHLQEDSFEQGDRLFLDGAINILDHHPEANAMIVDLLDDLNNIDLLNLNELIFRKKTKSILLEEGALRGTLLTNFIVNETGKPVRFPVLLTDQYTPEGCSILYEISYDGNTFHQLLPNQQRLTPSAQGRNEIEGAVGRFMLRIAFERENVEIEPRLDAWALLFLDEKYSFKFLDDGLTFDIESLWDGTIIK